MRTICIALILAAAAVGQQVTGCLTGTVSSTSFMATGNQEVIILAGVSGNTQYNQIILSETVKFSNISGLTVSIGRPGGKTNDEMTGARFGLGVSDGDANFWSTRPGPPQLTSNYSLVLAFSVPSGPLSVATAGLLTWEVCGYTLSPSDPTYLVGDVAPWTSDVAPNFGDGRIDVSDLNQIMLAIVVPQFQPTRCSDRFDAMDAYPVDSEINRGGDGVLDVRDLAREYLRMTDVDSSRPMRTSRAGACPADFVRVGDARRHTTPAGHLVLGVSERSSMTEQRTPIYLEVDSEIAKVAIAFALGDQRSEARFVANVEVPPSLVVQDRRAGLVAVAWLDGVNLRAGKRLLLGYLVGLVGTPQNLEVLGLSARGLDDDQDVLLDVTAAFETGSALSEIRTILLAPGSSIGMAGSFRWAAPPFSRQTSELVGILRP